MAKFERKTKEERESEIKEAALKVFLNKGYRNTTMEDIIYETTLSKGGVYRYFSNPREIMIAIMKDGNAKHLDQYEELKNKAEVVKKEEIYNFLANRIVNKILSSSKQKDLYLMFAYEILYDKELEEIFLDIERESFYELSKLVGNELDFFTDEAREKDRIFMSRLINGLLFAQTLFSDKEVFEERKGYIHKMFVYFFKEFI